MSEQELVALVAIVNLVVTTVATITIAFMKIKQNADGQVLGQVQHHTNSLVKTLVNNAERRGEEMGRTKEVKRAEQERQEEG